MTHDALAALVRLLTGATVRIADPAVFHHTCVYFANHSSHLDFLLIWSVLPAAQRQRTRPVAARDYWDRGTLRPWLAQRVFRAILVERHPRGVKNNPLEPMLDVVREGHSLIVFPEGTRSLDGHIGTFKPGLHHIARHWPDGRFVPVYLDNLNRVLPKGEVLPLPLLCSVNFGKPIRFDPDESRTGFLTRAEHAVKELTPHAT